LTASRRYNIVLQKDSPVNPTATVADFLSTTDDISFCPEPGRAGPVILKCLSTKFRSEGYNPNTPPFEMFSSLFGELKKIWGIHAAI